MIFGFVFCLPQVLAREALRLRGEKANAKALLATLEKMHVQYNSLANETSCLQSKLRVERDTSMGLETEVDRIREETDQLKEENLRLKTELRKVEQETRCAICYENKRNCLLMPCLHSVFCTRCVDLHFQHTTGTQARLCPLCRKGVSGVLVMQLD